MGQLVVASPWSVVSGCVLCEGDVRTCDEWVMSMVSDGGVCEYVTLRCMKVILSDRW